MVKFFSVSRRAPLYALVKVRLLEFVRDPAAIFWTFGFPILMAIGLGLAFDKDNAISGKVALTGPYASNFVDLFKDELQGVKPVEMSAAKAAEQLKFGNLDLLIQTETAAATALPKIGFQYDPSRPGALALRCLVDQQLQRRYGMKEPVAVDDQMVKEIGGRYIDFLLPGLIGINIMSSSIWGMGYSIVDDRKRKLIKRFLATPMRPSDFLLSFILSRLLFLGLEVLALILFGYLVFDVKVSGSPLALILVVLLCAFACSGIALLIGARTASTEVASGWMNFVQLPMWLLSGAYFSYSRFPESFLPLIRMLPLTASNDAMRIIFNQGGTFGNIVPECGVLLVWAISCFYLALKYFRWT